jgi:hypothetical protein
MSEFLGAVVVFIVGLVVGLASRRDHKCIFLFL